MIATSFWPIGVTILVLVFLPLTLWAAWYREDE